MINLLGVVVFGTIVGIGLLDGRCGLSVFACYHSAGVTGRHGWAPKTNRGGGENQSKPPTPAK